MSRLHNRDADTYYYKLKSIIMFMVYVANVNRHIVDCQDPTLAAVVALDTPPRGLEIQ